MPTHEPESVAAVLPEAGVPAMGTLATPPRAQPVRGGERVSSVDVLRGVALLGILLMSIVPKMYFFTHGLAAAKSGLAELDRLTADEVPSRESRPAAKYEEL
jgi:hypothetical protein